MNTRIKIVTKSSGDCIYTPQYKFLFMWRDFKKSYINSVGDSYRVPKNYKNIEEAKAVIDDYLGKMVNKVEYITYP